MIKPVFDFRRRLKAVILILLVFTVFLASCSISKKTDDTTTTEPGNSSQATTGEVDEVGTTSVDAVAIAWKQAEKVFSEAVLWRMIPSEDENATVTSLTSDWQTSDGAQAWTIWYADPSGENWLIINVSDNKLTDYDIVTRSWSTMVMPAEWPRATLPVSMKDAAAAAAAQGANLANLTWVEYSCAYPSNEVPEGPVWAITCSEATQSGSTLVYTMLVSGITGEVLGAVNERDEKLELPISLASMEETRADDHRADLMTFFSYFGSEDLSWAVRQLSYQLSPDEGTAQVWLANFQSLDSLEVLAIEPIRLAEWTTEWEAYKVTLQVTTQETPDKYGWDNGVNYRWITIIPQGAGAWKIDMLANSP